jgi:hypothetical protein
MREGEGEVCDNSDWWGSLPTPIIIITVPCFSRRQLSSIYIAIRAMILSGSVVKYVLDYCMCTSLHSIILRAGRRWDGADPMCEAE